MFERIKNFALYGDTYKESYYGIKHKIENVNRVTALIFASVAAVLIGVMLILSFSQEGFYASLDELVGALPDLINQLAESRPVYAEPPIPQSVLIPQPVPAPTTEPVNRDMTKEI